MNREYARLMRSSHYHRQRGHAEQAERLRKQAQSLPSIEVKTPEYRRLKYLRYADDFLLGFIGPKSEAEAIKQQVETFLREELKLELSLTKTLITHARSEAARFLGYEVTVRQADTKRCQTKQGTDRRNINGKIGLRVPREVIEEKNKRYKKNGKPANRPELEYESDYAILSLYQLEYRGLANYYRLAYNMTTLRKVKWVMENSLTRTLAQKFQVSVPKVYEKYGAELVVDGKRYKGLQVVLPRPEKKPLVATWGGIPLIWNIEATLEEQPRKLWTRHSELVQRLLAGYCELCGATENVEVHHVRGMKDLHKYPGRQKPEWVKRMIALKRKTMPLCRTCHEDVQYGRPLRRQVIKLAEVKALQKAKTMILESRVH